MKLEVDTISRSNNNNTWYYAYNDDDEKFGFIDSDFGEVVFLSKEEAEMKLREIIEKEDLVK
jgi:hypothetical protein